MADGETNIKPPNFTKAGSGPLAKAMQDTQAAAHEAALAIGEGDDPTERYEPTPAPTDDHPEASIANRRPAKQAARKRPAKKAAAKKK